MNNLRPNGERAKQAVTLIWIVLVLEIISLISGYFQYDLIQTALNGGEISTEAATANDLRERLIAIIYLIVYIISAVTFIQWFRRAYYNLHQKVKYLSYAEGWAAGSWFVPILNLFRPYQIMDELYTETKKLLSKHGLSGNVYLTSSALGWWWTLWIINGIIGQIIFRYSLNLKTIDEVATFTILNIVGNVLSIPLALIAIKVIKDYAEVEPRLHEIRDDGETDPGEATIGSLV